MNKPKIPSVGQMRHELFVKGGEVLPHHQREKNKAAYLKDSKVKDVMYHGTNEDFSQFYPYAKPKTQGGENLHGSGAMFFTPDRELANKYSGANKTDSTHPKMKETGGYHAWPPESIHVGNVMPVHLNMTNPLVVNAEGKMYHQVEHHILGAKKKGHDSVILRNVVDAPGSAGSLQTHKHDAHVVFNPKQIKSAIGNRGTFDPNDPDITKAKGGIISQLRRNGKGVSSELEAMRRMSQGHRVFVTHEQDERPREITSVRELYAYTPDQMYTLAPEAKAKGGSVPSEPGSTPIKEGHVRLYHQTDGDNLREIEKHGLLLKHAKGIEGPRAIYAGETPFYGDATKKPTLEFQVPKEHWDAPFVLRDVHPQDFISAHYPWHRHARYLEDESGIKNVLSGKFDTLKGDEGKAVEYIKNKYSTKKAKGGEVHMSEGGKPNDAAFIGYLSPHGKFESYPESVAKANDYHHSYTIKDLDAYNAEGGLTFVRMNSDPEITIKGTPAMDPFHHKNSPMVSDLARRIIKSGGHHDMPIKVEHMGFEKHEAPYQGKYIGTLRQWSMRNAEKKAKGGNVMPKYPSIEEMLQKLQESGRTPIMPAPDRWFKKPEQHPFQQKAIEKLLAYTGHNREAFPHGAHINPLTGEPLDFEIMHDLGVAIDPMTGTPRMSGIKSGLTEIDPKLGSLTKSNLIRKGLFKHEGGDPLLDRIKFLATIEKSGKGHHYGLSTHYESPAELVQEMRGNPTLRPHSRGDIYGVGDEVGRISIKGMHHPVFEKLVVAPSGMNVQGKKLHKAKGGKVTHAHHLEIEERPL